MSTNTAPRFGTGDGTLLGPIGIYDDYSYAMALQPNGKIVVAGASWNGSNYDFSLARYNADGSPDLTFSGDGHLTESFGSSIEVCRSVLVQTDGKIVTAGYTWNGHNYDLALARYTASGALDTTFGGDGKVTTAIGPSSEAAFAAALQSDGKILVAGYTWTGTAFEFAIVRYTTSGALDTTFSGDGIVSTMVGTGANDHAAAIVVQADGKIVVVGNAFDGGNNGYGFALVRYNANGTLDTTFSGDGKVITQIGASSDFASGAALQADGKIVVTGTTYIGNSTFKLVLARYNTDGSLDSSFDGDGIAVSTIESDVSQCSLALQADGKILVAATGYSNMSRDFVVARFNSNGTLDTTFDSDGVVTQTGSSAESATSIAVQTDGRILVGGDGWNGTNYDFAVSRYNADGTLDITFDFVNTLDAAPAYTENGAPIVLDADVNVYDTELDALNGGAGNYAGASLTLARGGGASAQDNFGFELSGASFTVSGGALQAGGQDFATFTRNGGTLTIRFTSSEVPATSALVDDVLRRITYANGSDTPPPNVLLDYLFSDGNTGAQGTGPTPGTVAGSVNVTIHALPEIHVWTQLAHGQSIAFNAAEDQLRIDDLSISARDMSVGTTSAVFSHGGKTVTLLTALRALGAHNVAFDDGSRLIVGDESNGTANDDGANKLVGGAGDDRLLGLGGDDSLNGDAGADLLDGGAGNDNLFGGAGADVLNGGADFDYARYDNSPAALTIDLNNPSASTGDALGDSFLQIEGVIGSPFADVIIGDAAVNVLQGRDGNDTIHGGAGNDDLYGGAGADVLNGGADFDYARYDNSLAALTIDMVTPSAGTGDALGDSLIQIEGVVGSPFADFIYGDAADNVLQGRNGNDALDGRAGNDNLHGGAGADVLDGGAGFDYARYDSALAALTIDMVTPSAGTGDALGDSFLRLEGIVGSPHADVIRGDAADNVLQGRNGNDTLDGRAGNDTLHGGAGADVLNGGADFDYASYDSSLGALTIDMNTPSAGTGDALGDSFLQIEGIIGSSFDDRIHGNSAANRLQGRNGNDTMDGRGGADRLEGGAGNDDFVLRLGEANGDTVADFDGRGALAGDELIFMGYGAGATFMKTSANTGKITYLGGSEFITFSNGASIDASDYTFV